jgi:Lrp/AsnC family transcriptional regulator for asnA, asnC and gidA
MRKIDDKDIKIIDNLIENASISIPKLSKKIGINSSVVYSRIKRLLRRKVIKKYTIELNEGVLGYAVPAIIGLNIDSKQRDSILKELQNILGVRSISEVTGRFDLIIELRSKTLDELHKMVSDKVGKINGVLRTETFIELTKKIKKPEYNTTNI